MAPRPMRAKLAMGLGGSGFDVDIVVFVRLSMRI